LLTAYLLESRLPFIAPDFVTLLTNREVVSSVLDFQGVLLGVSSAASHRCHQFYVIPWDLLDAARRDVEKELTLPVKLTIVVVVN